MKYIRCNKKKINKYAKSYKILALIMIIRHGIDDAISCFKFVPLKRRLNVFKFFNIANTKTCGFIFVYFDLAKRFSRSTRFFLTISLSAYQHSSNDSNNRILLVCRLWTLRSLNGSPNRSEYNIGFYLSLIKFDNDDEFSERRALKKLFVSNK